jgi:hypothetical protein
MEPMSTEPNALATGSEVPPGTNVEPEQDSGVAPADEPVTADESKSADDEGDKPSDPQKTIDKLLRRIQRQSGKIGATARERELIAQENATLKAQLAELRGEGGQTQEPAGLSIEEIAELKAREIVTAKALNERAADVLKAGKKVEGFDEALESLREEVPFIDGRKRPTAFFKALMKTTNPAQMIKHLGSDPEEAAEFVGLEPEDIGWRLAKLEAKLGAEVKTSSAPTPLKPVTARSTGGSSPRTPEELLEELRSLRR